MLKRLNYASQMARRKIILHINQRISFGEEKLGPILGWFRDWILNLLTVQHLVAQHFA